MSVFEFIAGRKKPTSGETAKERLKVVLAHDRLKLNPALLEIIREEILSVVEAEQVQVNLSQEGGAEALRAIVPINREKVSLDWDPPSYTPNGNVIHGTVRVADDEESSQQK